MPFFELFLPTLLEAGLITGDEAEAFWADWNARARDPAAFVSLPPMVDVIGVKE